MQMRHETYLYENVRNGECDKCDGEPIARKLNQKSDLQMICFSCERLHIDTQSFYIYLKYRFELPLARSIAISNSLNYA